MTDKPKSNNQLGRIEANIDHLVRETRDMRADIKEHGAAIVRLEEQHRQRPMLHPVPRSNSPSGLFRAMGKSPTLLSLIFTIWNMPGVKTVLALIGAYVVLDFFGVDFIKIIPAQGPPTPGSG